MKWGEVWRVEKIGNMSVRSLLGGPPYYWFFTHPREIMRL